MRKAPAPAPRCVRELLLQAARALHTLGLSAGVSGNLSMRWRDGLLITPSGQSYESMVAADLVWMDLDGRFEHRLAPS